MGIQQRVLWLAISIIILSACEQKQPVVDLNGSWFGECYPGINCEIYFDDDLMYFYHKELPLGLLGVEIQARTAHSFLLTRDSAEVQYSINRDTLDINFIAKAGNHFKLLRSPIEYHSPLAFCTDEMDTRSRNCDICVEDAFEVRWDILNNNFILDEEDALIFESQLDHYINLGETELADCYS